MTLREPHVAARSHRNARTRVSKTRFGFFQIGTHSRRRRRPLVDEAADAWTWLHLESEFADSTCENECSIANRFSGMVMQCDDALDKPSALHTIQAISREIEGLASGPRRICAAQVAFAF
jgi:hypothetical protein